MRCLQRTQRIQKYNTHPDRVCSPCFSLAKDTEVSSGIQPDYGAASFPWLWDSSVHHKDLILRSRCCTKDSNITVALQFLNPCHLKNGNKYSLYLVTGFTVTPFLSWIFLASSAHISGGRNSDMRRGGKQRSLTSWDICRGRPVLEFFLTGNLGQQQEVESDELYSVGWIFVLKDMVNRCWDSRAM